MIRNDRQYQYVKAHVKRLRDLLADVQARPGDDGLRTLETDAVRGQIAELQEQIEGYEVKSSV